VLLCSRLDDLDTALEIFSTLRSKDIRVSTNSMNLYLDSYAKAQDHAKTARLFEEMSLNGVHQNAESYKSLMEVLSRVEKQAEVLELFAAMKDKRIPLMVEHYTLALQACKRLSSYGKGMEILTEMQAAGVEGDYRFHKFAMQISYEAKDYGSVTKVYTELEQQGIEPTFEVLDLYLTASSRALCFLEAHSALVRMISFFPQQVTIEHIDKVLVALGSSPTMEDIQAMESIIDELKLERGASTLIHFLALYSKCNAFDSARKILHDLKASHCLDRLYSLEKCCRILCRVPLLATEVTQLLRNMERGALHQQADEIKFNPIALEANLIASEACALAVQERYRESNELMSSVTFHTQKQSIYAEDCRMFILFLQGEYAQMCKQYRGSYVLHNYSPQVQDMLLRAHVLQGRHQSIFKLFFPGVTKEVGMSRLVETLHKPGERGNVEKDKISRLMGILVQHGSPEQFIDVARSLLKEVIGKDGVPSPLDFFVAKRVLLNYGGAAGADMRQAAAVLEKIFHPDHNDPQGHNKFVYLCNIVCRVLRDENRDDIVSNFIEALNPQIKLEIDSPLRVA
jgi:hypothetical protein